MKKNFIQNPGFSIDRSDWIDHNPETKYRISIPFSKAEVSMEDREMIHLAIQALNRMNVITDLQVSVMAAMNGQRTLHTGWRFNIPNRIEF